MKKLSSLLIILLMTLSVYAALFIINWQITDETYSITFKTKGVKGNFNGLRGTIIFAEMEPSHSKFDVTVDVRTINTGIGLKNKHALAGDFFDAEHYHLIRFSSTAVIKSDSGFIVSGPLTIRDMTKEITFPFSFERSGSQGVFKGSFEINRKDFALDKKGIGEIIEIALNIPVRNDTIQ